jgi:hypothetical protein
MNASGLKRGGSPGRPKGTPNRATVEVREFAGRIIDDPDYQAKLRRGAIFATLSPTIEALLRYCAKGKPEERIDLSLENELRALLEVGRLRNAARLNRGAVR